MDSPTRLLLPGEEEALNYLAASTDTEAQTEPDNRFTILKYCEGDPVRAAGLASHLVMVYGQMQEAAQQVRAIAALHRAQVDAWEADQLERIDAEQERLAHHLQVYADDAYPRATRTIRLPNGELRRRAGSERIKLASEEELLEWLREHDPEGWDDLVKLVPKLDLAAFRKRLEKVGDGGVTYTPTGEYLATEGPVAGGEIPFERKLGWVETSPETFTVKPLRQGLPAAQEVDNGNE